MLRRKHIKSIGRVCQKCGGRIIVILDFPQEKRIERCSKCHHREEKVFKRPLNQ